jgi:hypothetical protein
LIHSPPLIVKDLRSAACQRSLKPTRHLGVRLVRQSVPDDGSQPYDFSIVPGLLQPPDQIFRDGNQLEYGRCPARMARIQKFARDHPGSGDRGAHFAPSFG